MKKKSKEKEYLYGYLDYVMNRFDTEFVDYENEFSYILNNKFFKIVILYEDIFADVTFLDIMLSYNVYYYQDLAEELGTEQDIVMWPLVLITQTLFWRWINMDAKIRGALIGVFYLNGLILPLSLLTMNIHDAYIVYMVTGSLFISALIAIILICAGFFKVGE